MFIIYLIYILALKRQIFVKLSYQTQTVLNTINIIKKPQHIEFGIKDLPLFNIFMSYPFNYHYSSDFDLNVVIFVKDSAIICTYNKMQCQLQSDVLCYELICYYCSQCIINKIV